MPTSTVIYKKLASLEAGDPTPQGRNTPCASAYIRPYYMEKAIRKVVKQTREDIWQKHYAKKIARIR